jgi:hypothetical protein
MAKKDSPDSEVTEWLNTISAYDRTFKKWEGRVEKILKRYRDDSRGYNDTTAKFNVLWSNVQTISPAVFSRLPKPEVTRRYRDNDPVGRVASIILQRALEFEVEHYPDYKAAMKNCVQDRFLGGRGIAWVRYEPHFGVPDDGFQITEDADEAQDESEIPDDTEKEVIEYECAPVDYVHWREFGHKVARTWEEVTAVWRKVYLSRSACVERFGEELGNKIPLDASPKDDKKISKSDDMENQALIYEIWDKETDSAIWLSKSMNRILDKRDDPLELENFFPCPRPLYATLTSDSLEPVPDFSLYQDQAKELDSLADKIDGLIKALRVRGVYDASVPELMRLFSEGEDNALLPVKNWSAFSEKQGLRGAIDLVDLAPIASALVEAYKAMDQVKQQIYDITGISDIIRGQTNANETATAQQIKGQYASLRLKSMQNEVSEFAQELIQIKAQIMCKHFSPETLTKLAAVQQMSFEDQSLIPQAIQMLTQDPLMSFRIEVAADSMVQADEDQEKKDRMEFLTAAGTFIEKAGQAAAAEPMIVPLVMDMLKFGVTAFKVGRTMEGEFDKVADEMKAKAAQPQPPKPDPAMAKVQQDGQLAQGEMQLKQAELQQTAQASQMRLQMEQQRDEHAMQLKAQTDQLKMQQELQISQQQQAHEQFMEQSRQQFEQWKIEFETAAKVTIAQISAKTQMDAALMAAESAASNEVTEDLGGEAETAEPDHLGKLADMHGQTLQAIQGMAEALTKPKTILRGPDGRVSGVQ